MKKEDQTSTFLNLNSVDLHMSNFYFQKLSDRERHEREISWGINTKQLFSKNEKIKESVNQEVVHLLPNYFIHVLDCNSNIVKLVEGPKTLTLKTHEKVVLGPNEMISLPINHYCIIENPVMKNSSNEIIFDEFGQACIRHGKIEVRFDSHPFPLYPKEILRFPIKPIPIIPTDSAIQLKATTEFVDTFSEEGKKITRKANEVWFVKGPRLFIPDPHIEIVGIVKAVIIEKSKGLKLRAKMEFIDRNGISRKAGEEWLFSLPGPYLPDFEEEIIGIEESIILNHNLAIHIGAKKTFVDRFGKVRKSGERWLVTREDCSSYLLSAEEELIQKIPIVALNKNQYCVIVNPIDETSNKNMFGSKKLVKGETKFFLHPEEVLEMGIQDAIILGPEEALKIQCLEPFYDKNSQTQRQTGEKWLLYGPKQFIPSLQEKVIEKRKALIQLDLFSFYFFYWINSTT